MPLIYLLTGEDSFLINRKIESLKKQYKDYEYIPFDLTESPLENVLEALDTFDLWMTSKLVVASNAQFLTAEGKKEISLDQLEKYIDHPNPSNILVLTCNKLDERKKIVKKLLKVSEHPTLEVNPKTLVTEALEDYEITPSDRMYLINRCGNNYEKLVHECEKLKLYCYDQKKITQKDIEEVVSPWLDDNIFDLVDAIVNRKKEKSYQIYQELLSHNEEPLKILVLVANQFHLLYQVKVWHNEGKKENEIASLLKVHPYRVKLALEKERGYLEKELLDIITELADLDEAIKQGTTYQNIGFELFLLNR